MFRRGPKHERILPFRGDEREHRIFFQIRVTAEISPGCQPLKYSASENGDIEVAGLLSAPIGCDFSRPDGCEGAAAAFIGGESTKSREVWINAGILRIIGMVILPFRVGLPDLNHGIRNRDAFAIEHANPQPHAFTSGLGSNQRSHTMTVRAAKMKKGADRL